MAAATVNDVPQMIASAIGTFNTEMDSQHATLKSALDKEFDAIRAEAKAYTTKVETAHVSADAQVRADYAAMQLRVGAVETAVENQELRAHELDSKLQRYEQPQKALAYARTAEFEKFKQDLETAL